VPQLGPPAWTRWGHMSARAIRVMSATDSLAAVSLPSRFAVFPLKLTKYFPRPSRLHTFGHFHEQLDHRDLDSLAQCYHLLLGRDHLAWCCRFPGIFPAFHLHLHCYRPAVFFHLHCHFDDWSCLGQRHEGCLGYHAGLPGFLRLPAHHYCHLGHFSVPSKHRGNRLRFFSGR